MKPMVMVILVLLVVFSISIYGQEGIDPFADPSSQNEDPFSDVSSLRVDDLIEDVDGLEKNFEKVANDPQASKQLNKGFEEKFDKLSHLTQKKLEADDSPIDATIPKNTEGSLKDGNLEFAKADEASVTSSEQTKVSGTNINNGKINEDGSFEAESVDEATIESPDFLLSGSDAGLDTSFTNINFGDAKNLNVEPNGNFKASQIGNLELSRPNFQLYLDDNRHIKKNVLPVKATVLQNAKNVVFANGILKAERADSITIDETTTEKVFDLTLTSAELDVSIPKEYVNVPALKFEQATLLKVADNKYEQLKDVVAVIQDNTILYIQATSNKEDNMLTFPNPIPLSTEEIRITLNKNKDMQYLLKDTDVRAITTLKELVVKSLTQEELRTLYDDFVRKRGLNAVQGTPGDTVYKYLEDSYSQLLMNLLPIPTTKIESIKKIFNEFYNNQILQEKIYNLLSPEEQNILTTRYLVMKNYDLNINSYSESDKKAFVYLFTQIATTNKILSGVDGISKDKILQIKSLLREKTITKKGKQINIVTEDQSKTEFITEKTIINSTTEGNGKLFVTEGTPPVYSFSNQTVNFNGDEFVDEIIKSDRASSAEIDVNFGFECLTLAPNSDFFYHDDKLEKSFSVVSNGFYSLCIKRDSSQILEEDLLCENCGYVNFVNKSIVLNGLVSYSRIPFYKDSRIKFYSTEFKPVYESFEDKNNGIFILDEDNLFINFLLFQGEANNANIYYGFYRLSEQDGKTKVSMVDARAKVIQNYLSKNINLKDFEGMFGKKGNVILTDKDVKGDVDEILR